MARLRATGCVRQEFRSFPVSQLASFRALGPQRRAANQAAGKAKTQAGNQRALSPPSRPVFTMVTMRATKALMPAESSPVCISRQSKESGLERIESPAMNIRRSPDMKKAARGKSRLFQACHASAFSLRKTRHRCCQSCPREASQNRHRSAWLTGLL